MNISKEQIVAMAIGVIAEQTQEKLENLRVVSFREVAKSSLEQYIDDHRIQYRKYHLGE